MRVYHHLTVLCLCLLTSPVVSAVKSLGEFTEYDLKEMEKIISAVMKQKTQLKSTISKLEEQALLLKETLTFTSTETIPALEEWQSDLDSKLLVFAQSLKLIAHSMEIQTQTLAGEEVLTNCQEAQNLDRWNMINLMTENNNQQDAQMTKMNATLKKISEELHAQISVGEDEAKASITEVTNSAKAIAKFVNTRHCFMKDQTIDIPAGSGVGYVTIFYPAGVFSNMIPLTQCTMRGFDVNLDAGKSHPYGYEDLFKGTGVKVTCETYPDRVVLSAYDNSKGKNKAVTRAFVNTVLCSMGPQFTYPSTAYN